MRTTPVVTLEFVGGPRDGEDAPIAAPAEVTRGWHRYVLTKDDTGALFYEYRGRVEPPASRRAA